MFENVDIHTHIRKTEAYLYYKLTNEPKGSGELITMQFREVCLGHADADQDADILPYNFMKHHSELASVYAAFKIT